MFRIKPSLPAAAFKTYQVVSPLSTHFRKATCEEIDCQAYTNGWRTVIDESVELGQKQAYYIRKESKRSFKENKTSKGLTEFLFPAGQTCFTSHILPTGRSELYFVRGGDHRGNPLGTKPYKHTKPELWVEDFQEHQDKIKNQIEKG